MLDTEACMISVSTCMIDIHSQHAVIDILLLSAQVRKAQELINSGTIGEPYFAQANYWESVGRYTLEIYTRFLLITTQNNIDIDAVTPSVKAYLTKTTGALTQ